MVFLQSESPTKKWPGVSVVIPSYNCKIHVLRLVKSLQTADYPNLEILVVDNGSKDETVVEGRKKYRWVKWIDAGKKNIGQTGCYNLGLAHAKKSNHILYCDADVVVTKNMVSKLVERAESDLKIGIVTPMILYLSDKNWVNQAGAEVNLYTGKVSIGWGPKKNFLEPRRVQNSGTVMLIKRGVVKKIGGFDNWFMCYFDPDYCLRAKKAGFETWYEPSARCFHDQSKNPNVWRPRILQRAFLLGRNRILFMRRHGVMLTFILFLPFMLGFYLLEAIRYQQIKNFFDLFWGTVVGFSYPLRKENYLPLPKIKWRLDGF